MTGDDLKRPTKSALSKITPPETTLDDAAKTYGRALRYQAALSTALNLARSRGEDDTALDREHDAACDALGDIEHELLVQAAIVGGWTRQDAEGSV